ILATVMCNNQTGNQNPFSRIMLIDFTVPNNPYYFDITGWVEQHYPNWQPGEANGLSTTCHIVSDSLLTTTSILQNPTNKITLYPNPTNNLVNINSNFDFVNAEINIYSTLGQNVKSIAGISDSNIILSTKDLQNGVYFLVLTNGNAKFIEKLVIQRQ
ncbi:MAG: T9SS type A sorting domain-containing protein, partial [Bacteroidetes bacterium]|nr:T9SS type A sorting domain-containing protein [Bacteroidota bacterium]